jgi:transcriptional regulator with XRE-family HTH domain
MHIVMESDKEILLRIGGFIQQERLRQQFTQNELAVQAGIGRSTLSLLERGEPVVLPSLIMALRALGRLDALSTFQSTPEISPIAMYKAEMKQRKRARKSAGPDHLAAEPDW